MGEGEGGREEDALSDLPAVPACTQLWMTCSLSFSTMSLKENCKEVIDGHPSDNQDKATQTVLHQAESHGADWAG
jgi:hypothetical protein